MEYALAKKVSEIVKQDSLKEIPKQKNSFCDKMNDLFSSVSSADIANLGADVTSFISALHSTTSMQAIIPSEILEGLKKVYINLINLMVNFWHKLSILKMVQL